jgi:hypothetical protein
VGYNFKEHRSVGNFIPGAKFHEPSRVCFNAYEWGIYAAGQMNKFTDGGSHARIFYFFHNKPVENCVLFRIVAVQVLQNTAVIEMESLE